MEVKPLKRSQNLLNIFFGFLCLFVFLSSVEQENLNPNTCDKKQKHLTFFNDQAQNFPPFLSYLNQGSKFCSSRRSSRLRPVGIDIRTLSQMEANCEKKENILKETLLKQRIDSLTKQFTQKNGAI